MSSSVDAAHSKRKKVGKYILGPKLGEGTFSHVRSAEDTTSGKIWAIKIMEIANIQKEGMEEQLKREIAISKKLKHPLIVEMREVFKTKHNINIVLELVRGGELFDKIVQARRFPEDVARHFFQQLLIGLDYCHKQGVAHRDLKPENLLVDESDNLKLMDFGLSAFQENALLQTTCGTPNYVAPEVLTEKGYDGFKADVWSCGVILYVMLAGRLPFEDRNMRKLFDKIQRADYVIPPHFSAGSVALIRKMLVVDPSQRPSIEDLFSDPWVETSLHKQPCWASKAEGSIDLECSEDEIREAFGETEEEEYIQQLESASSPTDSMTALELFSHITSGNLCALMGGSTAVNNNTKFMVSRNADNTVELLTNILRARGIEVVLKEESRLLKCTAPMSGRVLTFIAHCISISGQDLCLVDMRPGRGDRLYFYDLYREVKEECSE